MRSARCRVAATSLFSSFILAACGGGGGGGGGAGGGGGPPMITPTSFPVGGTVTGLVSSGLVLQNNGGEEVTIGSGASAFTFPTVVPNGGTYSVSIKTQPNIGPLQVCTVTNGDGNIAGATVTSVTVTCVTKTAKFLYVPNQSANTVSAYTIDASTGTLAAVAGSPFATEPTPRFVTAEPSGKFVYVTTLGSSTSPPRISGFALNGTSGALTALADSPFDLGGSTPPAAGSLFITAPALNPAGAFGYLSVWNPPPTPTAQLYGATMDATSGDLADIAGTPLPVGYEAQSPVFDPTGKFAFLARDTSPNSSGEIMTFNVSSPSGVLTPSGTPASTGGNRPIAAATPDGKYVLASNAASGTFVVMAVDSAGTVSMVGSPVVTGAAGTAPGVPIYTRRLGVVYLANAPLVGGSTPSLAAYRVDGATGALTMLAGSPYDSKGATLFPMPHPSGKFLYQVNGSTVQRYSLDQATGVPTLLGDVTTPADPPGFLVPDPSGRYVYVTSGVGGSVSSYSVDQTTGALTLVNTVAAGAGAFFPQPVGLQ